MFGALKSQRISVQILLPFVGFIPFLVLLIWPATDIPLVHNAQGLIYSTYFSLLESSPMVLLFASFIILIIFATFLFWVNTNFEITGQRTVLVSYMFFFIACTPLYISYLNPALLSSVLVLLGLVSIFTIYHRSQHLTRIFNGGLFYGLAVLCYPPFLFVLPVFILAVARMKQPRLRDFLILILGFCTVLWIYGAYIFLKGDLSYEWISITQWFEFRNTWPIPVPGNRILQLLWLVWLLLMLPMAIAVARSRKDVGRRIISVLIQLLWIAPALVLVFERVSFEVWGLITVPISILFSLAVMNSKRKWMLRIVVFGILVFLTVFHLERIL